MESVLGSFDWKGFEQMVGKILEENGFGVDTNVRFKTDRRYEIDVLAENRDLSLSIDCKEWSRGRYKKTALSKAAEKQSERTSELELHSKNGKKYIPMIVTLFEEDIKKEKDVIIVPVWKLNSFLNEELVKIAN